MRVDFEGIDDLNQVAAELRASSVRAEVDGIRALRAAAFAVQANAMLIVPVDTGTLRSSISVEFFGGLTSGGWMIAEIGPETHYGKYVEFGTSRQAPQAFMGPSLDRIAPVFVAAIAAMSDPFRGGVSSGGFSG
jgi:HK97 gp10 family phage protein